MVKFWKLHCKTRWVKNTQNIWGNKLNYFKLVGLNIFMTSGAVLRAMGAKPSLSSMIPPHSSQLYLQTTCFHEHLIHSDLYLSTS